jgi:hypothetical protein
MSASLRRRMDAHTVLTRMARDKDRAERIRALKARYGKEVTWGEIAEYVGVVERSVLAWQATGEISRDNAFKLAQFFIERGEPISEEYVWRGADPTPLELVHGGRQEISQRYDELLGRLAQVEDQLRRLRAEMATADAEALKRNEQVLSAIRDLRP